MEEMRNEITAIMADYLVRLTKTTKRQDSAITNISNRLDGLVNHRESDPEDQNRPPDGRGRIVKVECPKFKGVGIEGWLFQAEEYFEYHEISDASKVRIADF